MKRRIKEFISNFWAVLKRPGMSQLSGQLAFFFVLALVPIITILVYISSFFHLSTDFMFEFLSKALSKDLAKFITPIVIAQKIDFQFLIFMVVGFYIASNGSKSIILTSNAIYGVKDANLLKVRIKAIIMTFVLVLLFMFIISVPLFGTKIIELIKYVDLNANVTNKITFIFEYLKGPISWLVIFVLLVLIYTLAPDRKVQSANTVYGSVFTSVGWVLAIKGYSYYISNLANFNMFYGNLANIVILMLWFYLLSTIFVIGMALNYHDEEIKLAKTGQIIIDKE